MGETRTNGLSNPFDSDSITAFNNTEEHIITVDDILQNENSSMLLQENETNSREIFSVSVCY